MQLSKRLQAVADLITPGNRVADIGCDHAYTSIYLVKHDISPHIIAMDVNQGPIDRARENILKYRCEDKIEVRRSNGLEKLGAEEADSIIIAGMGGGLTIQILSERIELVKTLRELVLQPQSEIYKVREMLKEHDFLITDENMIKEDGKYYVMMKAKRSNLVDNQEEYVLTEEEHFQYGRLLLEQKHPILLEFLLWDLSICEDIVNSLELETSDNAMLRRREIQEKIRLIGCGLKFYDHEA